MRRYGVVLVVLLAGCSAPPHSDPDPPTPVPSASPSASAVPSGDLQALGVRALEQLGQHVGDGAGGAVFGPVDAGTEAFTYTFGTEREPYPPGSYELRAVCLGASAGNIQVSWEGGSTIVGCGGEASRALVTLAAPGVLPLEIKGDDAARGQAGAAVVVTSPSLMALRNAFPAGATPVMAGEAVTEAERRDAGRLPADGDYQLVVGCVGPTPTVVVTVTPADGVGARTVKCGRLENGALTGRPTIIALPHRLAGTFAIRLTVPYRTMIVKYALRRVSG